MDASGEIVCFENGGCPWKDYLFTAEEELKLDPKIKFVLFPDQNNNWRVQVMKFDFLFSVNCVLPVDPVASYLIYNFNLCY